MFVVDETWLMPVNIAIAAVFALFFIVGAKRGLLRMGVSLIGTVVCFYGAWFLSSVLAKYIHIWPDSWAILQDTPYAEAAKFYMNEICWMLALFLVFRLLFFFIDKIAKGLSKIPVFDLLNNLGGGAVGIVEAALLAVLFTISLNTPLFQNGNLLKEQTILKQINEVTGMVFQDFVSPSLDGQALEDLYKQGVKLSEEERKALEQWFEANGFGEEAESIKEDKDQTKESDTDKTEDKDTDQSKEADNEH